MNNNLLGFGFMRLPLVDEEDRTVIDLDRVNEMVDAYIDAGYDYFDTGYYYHGGKSEEAIRECVVKRYPREKIKIADKLPVFALKSEDDMERIFEEQLERCGVNTLTTISFTILAISLTKGGMILIPLDFYPD